MQDNLRYHTIFQFYLNPKIVTNRRGVAKAVFGANVVTRSFLILKSLAGNLYHFFATKHVDAGKVTGKNWLVLGSLNQEAATAFLQAPLAAVVLTTDFYQAKSNAINLRWWHLPKLFYLPKYFPFLWSVFRENPRHFFMVFHLLIHGISCLENHRETLKKYRPTAVFVSNDSLPFFRALLVAAEELSIPTVYLQHASVSDDFPPLIADLSLLDGQDAMDKYTAGGKPYRGKIKLVGSPKYDHFIQHINRSEQLKHLGIPYGFYDEPEKVEALVVALLEEFPGLRISLRKHPRDTRGYSFSKLPEEVNWSSSRTESIYEFLTGRDAIIASDSAVHLEATLLNVSSYYYPLLSRAEAAVDVYGFVRNGLIPLCTSREDLFQHLRSIMTHRPPVRAAAAYYVGNLNTPAEGRSQELSLTAIQELLTRWPHQNV